jgi:hypothetical protein
VLRDTRRDGFARAPPITSVRNLRWPVAVVILATSFACLSPPVASVQTRVIQQTPIRVLQNGASPVDILFLVDNSQSMDAMQTELKQKFSEFFTVFQDLAAAGTYADLNIGVITSDYGAGSHDNLSTVNGITKGCQASPGGQRGLLQTTAAAHQSNTGCAGPTGAPFIHYAFGPSGATSSNLPTGASLADTFTCMASVGADGCGFEHQLESVYAALTNTKENAGFLRKDALLAVVFVTNEDDGSAPPTSMIYESNVATAQYGIYDTYRQTRFGVACGSPPMLAPYAPVAALADCAAAENDDSVHLGSEYDVSRYVTLLTHDDQHGGIKPDPDHEVILVGIVAPVTPFGTIVADLNTGLGAAPSPTYQPCKAGAMVGDAGCGIRLQHSCQNMASPGFFGDPPVRLDAVIGSAKLSSTANICGDDPTQPPDYSAALKSVAALIANNIGPGCIPAKLTSTDAPDCVVVDVTTDGNGHVVKQAQYPACALDGNRDPLPTNSFPCWAVQVKPACATQSPQSLGVTIFRNGQNAPPNTTASVECSTIAETPQ